MALTLYFHPLSSFCQKVLIALYENDTPFDGHIIDLGDSNARTAFLKLWPTGKIPLLRDESHDRTVPETSIMIEYLDRHYPGARPLLPQDPAALLEARLWDRLFDLYVEVPMQKVVADRLRAEGDQRGAADAIAALGMAYDMIEHRIGDRMWAAGELFSIADCAAAPALFYASIVKAFPQNHRRLAGYFERLMARPTIKRTLAEARPFFQFFPFKESIPARFLAD
jgi:glutathione S-transferase